MVEVMLDAIEAGVILDALEAGVMLDALEAGDDTPQRYVRRGHPTNESQVLVGNTLDALEVCGIPAGDGHKNKHH